MPNDTRNALARIPLRWMIRQCFLTNTGILFQTDLLRTIGLDPATLYPVVKPRPPPVTSPTRTQGLHTTNVHPSVGDASAGINAPKPTEEDEDLADALCPIYDQLSLRKGWWLLELLPMKHHMQRSDDSWTSKVSSVFLLSTMLNPRAHFYCDQDESRSRPPRAIRWRIAGTFQCSSYCEDPDGSAGA